MRCPECHSLNEPGAAACATCGLILVKLPIKGRRAEDQAEQKRRQTDLEAHRRAEDLAVQRRRTADAGGKCEYCDGTISTKAVRCKHCGEILKADYYRERAQRLRARINYASWVAYIFGLGALLVFRPVGLVSIGAGLLLSIVYYAIPVEPPAAKGKRTPFVQILKRQLRLERVSVPIPNFKNRKLVFVGTPLIAALIGYSANVFLLQEPMNQVLKQNSAFAGMDVSAHYEYYIDPGVVVYDLKKISVHQTPIDVHTAFLEFAKKLRDKKYSRIELSYRGTTKFQIDGASFHKLGVEYAKRNFDYVLYTFPRLFRSVSTPEPQTKSDHDALVDFHRRWYGEDQLTRSVANGL
jgi:hypothetical protein